MMRPMAPRARKSMLAALLAAFVACVWLNQSVGQKALEDLRDEVFADPSAHRFDYVRYPLLFLYRRATDEALYEVTAAAILGLPYDPEVLSYRGTSSLDGPAWPADGHWHVPYREVPLEYPPPVLPFILLPKVLTHDFEHFAYAFGALMGACLLGAMRMAIGISQRARAAVAVDDVAWRWTAGAVLLLAHGAIAIQRLDAIVALELALAVHAAVRRKAASTGFWLGLAAATKLTPLMLAPVLVAADWSWWRERRVLLRGAASFGGAILLGLGPMFLASTSSFARLLHYHSARGLHVESALGTLYGTACALAGHPERATLDYGSFNFHTATADALAKSSTLLMLALIAFVSLRAARADHEDNETSPDLERLGSTALPEGHPARVRRIVCALLAGMIALWLGGKVLSPQYLTWALPLILAVPGRAVRPIALFGMLCLLVGQIYFRGYFDYVYEQRPLGVVTMAVRLSLLVAWLAACLRAMRPPEEVLQ